MDALDCCFSKDKDIVSRAIAGEMILVPIRNNIGDLSSIYVLNELGAFIWEKIDGRTKVSSIRDAVISEYDVATEEAEKDLLELLNSLTSLGAIRLVED